MVHYSLVNFYVGYMVDHISMWLAKPAYVFFSVSLSFTVLWRWKEDAGVETSVSSLDIFISNRKKEIGAVLLTGELWE